MSQGIQTDPVTGRPLGVSRREAAEEDHAANEKQARRSAELLRDLDGEAGQALIGVIEHKLRRRIDKVLKDDPEAAVLLELLNTLGSQRSAAKVALDRYIATAGHPAA